MGEIAEKSQQAKSECRETILYSCSLNESVDVVDVGFPSICWHVHLNEIWSDMIEHEAKLNI
jgi:hypothetical protein